MARATFQLPNNLKPLQGPCGLGINFDFTGGVLAIPADLMREQQSGIIDYVQSIFIDNRLNGSAFKITFSGFSFVINCKANRQGLFPVLAPSGGALSFLAESAGGVVVPTIMINVPMAYFTWDV